MAASEQVILVMHQLLVAPADGSEQGDGSERGDESYQGDGSGHDLEAGTIPYGSYWSAQEYRYPRVSWARRSWSIMRSIRRRAQERGGEQERGDEQEAGREQEAAGEQEAGG